MGLLIIQREADVAREIWPVRICRRTSAGSARHMWSHFAHVSMAVLVHMAVHSFHSLLAAGLKFVSPRLFVFHAVQASSSWWDISLGQST